MAQLGVPYGVCPPSIPSVPPASRCGAIGSARTGHRTERPDLEAPMEPAKPASLEPEWRMGDVSAHTAEHLRALEVMGLAASSGINFNVVLREVKPGIGSCRRLALKSCPAVDAEATARKRR
jgi:hypothetical protein